MTTRGIQANRRPARRGALHARGRNGASHALSAPFRGNGGPGRPPAGSGRCARLGIARRRVSMFPKLKKVARAGPFSGKLFPNRAFLATAVPVGGRSFPVRAFLATAGRIGGAPPNLGRRRARPHMSHTASGLMAFGDALSPRWRATWVLVRAGGRCSCSRLKVFQLLSALSLARDDEARSMMKSASSLSSVTKSAPSPQRDEKRLSLSAAAAR